ncbi:MAG: tryptophan synthase subunit alpha [Candidatus Omnitrophica bacterium]|nr:tryptophan synthase subunit alpha [Candidatus Omnitrophota bacterium]MCM8826326.1 tryptophan synthase subunit alpha [Candidatus Omnitrophota bacterium]
MGRIEEKFYDLRIKDKKAFIVYVPFGFPNISLSRDIILTLQESGVDLVELGLPFSDPLADGSILQEANQIALQAKATTDKLFSFLQKFKEEITVPLILMSYYNPLYRWGLKDFLSRAKYLGIDGIMVVDLPLEESSDYISIAKRLDLDTIFFITPTTSLVRKKKIMEVSRGFVYYISVTGITGPKNLSLQSIRREISSLRKMNQLPICVGFGIHSVSQARKIREISDGIILGSVIVEFIKENFKKRDFLKSLNVLVRRFCV